MSVVLLCFMFSSLLFKKALLMESVAVTITIIVGIFGILITLLRISYLGGHLTNTVDVLVKGQEKVTEVLDLMKQEFSEVKSRLSVIESKQDES